MRAHPLRIFRAAPAALALALTAAAPWAQEADPGETAPWVSDTGDAPSAQADPVAPSAQDDSPAPPAEADSTTPSAGEPANAPLAACITDRDRLAQFTTDLSSRLAEAQAGCQARIDEETAPLAEALTICQEEVATHQRTNITLNDRLLACEPVPQADPDRIAELEAEVARLTERLANAGLGAEAGYGYAGGSVWSSFVAGDELERVQGSLPKLPVEDCPAALDWLAGQTGADRAVRIELWVWEAEAPQVCRRNADGTTGLAPARPQDEAHVVIFR